MSYLSGKHDSLQKIITTSNKFSNYWKSINLKKPSDVFLNHFRKEINACFAELKLDIFADNLKFKVAKASINQVSYFDVYNDGFLVIMVMFLPENYFLEYHDHPNMYVFSKIAEGELTLTQFDLFDKDEFYTKPKMIGSCFRGRDFSTVNMGQNSIAELFPDQNNIHAMLSNKRCIVVDVLLNYYDDERLCSYFKVDKNTIKETEVEKIQFIREE